MCFVSKFSDNVIEEIQNKLQDIRNPMAAMMVLLRELDLETDSECGADRAVTPGICGRSVCCSLWRCPAHERFHAGLNTRIHLSRLYGSSSAVSLICQAVCHMSMTRVLLCRDLLILQKLYLRFGDNVGPQHHPKCLSCQKASASLSSCTCQVFLGGGSQLLQLQQDLVPRSSHMLTSYHLLKHISQSLASSVPVDIMWVSCCCYLPSIVERV